MADEDDEWAPLSSRTRPDFGALLTADDNEEFDLEDQTRFFELLAEDYGPMEIGLSMGWSPAAVKRFVTEPSRAELIEMVTEAQHESVERGIIRGARAANSTAMKLYAYNKMQHRGWADRSKLEITGKSQQEIVISVGEAISEKLRATVGLGGTEGVRALQAAFLEPDIPEHSADIIDAEIVEPDEDVHG